MSKSSIFLSWDVFIVTEVRVSIDGRGLVIVADDPFIALDKADRWCKENQGV
jgi:hypothetical protein